MKHTRTRPTVGLIDADILVYKYGHACTDRVQWTPESEEVSWCCLESAKELIAEKLRFIKDDLWLKELVVVLSPHKKNFRHEIYPEYKANRGPSPEFVSPLKAWIKQEYASVYTEEPPYGCAINLEADDILGMRQQGTDTVICTIDKDLLQIPGWNYNLNSGNLTWVDELEADRWLFTQALAGDSADNYKGAPGIGLGKAASLLEGAKDYTELYWRAYMGFRLTGQPRNILDMSLMLAHIYRRGEGTVDHWQPRAKLTTDIPENYRAVLDYMEITYFGK